MNRNQEKSKQGKTAKITRKIRGKSQIGNSPDAKVQAARESFRNRVDSMSNEQLTGLIRETLDHPSAGNYLRILVNPPINQIVPSEDVLRFLSELRQEDKRSQVEKARSNMEDAKTMITDCHAQVEALALSTIALIGDLRKGKINLVREELIQRGLRNAWQALVDSIDYGLSHIDSAITNLSPPTPVAP